MSCIQSPGLGSRMVPQDLAGPKQQDCSPIPGCHRCEMDHEHGQSCRRARAECVSHPMGRPGIRNPP